MCFKRLSSRFLVANHSKNYPGLFQRTSRYILIYLLWFKLKNIFISGDYVSLHLINVAENHFCDEWRHNWYLVYMCVSSGILKSGTTLLLFLSAIFFNVPWILLGYSLNSFRWLTANRSTVCHGVWMRVCECVFCSCEEIGINHEWASSVNNNTFAFRC